MNVYSPATATPTDRAEQFSQMAFSAIALGNWPDASGAADECRALAEATGQREAGARGEVAAGIVAAVRGETLAAQALLERSERHALRQGQTELLDVVQLGRGIEALSAARYDEALAHLRQLVDSDVGSKDWVRLVALGYLAEIALHCGGPAAATVLATVENTTHLTSTQPLLGATAYARAIASREVAVDATFDRALRECPVDRDFDRARLNLAWGVRLRRERRVSESRGPLLDALVAFERLGATTWAAQARGELRATGARRVRRALGDPAALTCQELQIVRMAAAGMSNREIGQRLFLSHRTIGSHLYRAFPKLGVAARWQLRDVLLEGVGLQG